MQRKLILGISSHKKAPGAPHPRIPVGLDGVGELHAAFLNESRTSGRRLGPRTGNPGHLARFSRDVGYREPLFMVSTEPRNGEDKTVVSHISQKTSEMWGTH
jgi:hypothetical protein